jgi:hypothetical protein
MTKIIGFSQFSKHEIEYPDIPSALRPVSHDDTRPGPKPPESYTLDSDSELEEVSPEGTGPNTTADPDFSTHNTSEPHLITLVELRCFSLMFGHPLNKGSATWIMA